MVANVEITNEGCHYGARMASREVKVTGIEDVNTIVKVLVDKKRLHAKRWAKNHHIVKGFPSDLDAGAHYLNGPLRKEGMMGLMSIFISNGGEFFALAFECKQTEMQMTTKEILKLLQREKVAGSASTSSLIKPYISFKKFDDLDRILPTKARKALDIPLREGSVDEDLILQGVSTAAVCCKCGFKEG